MPKKTIFPVFFIYIYCSLCIFYSFLYLFILFINLFYLFIFLFIYSFIYITEQHEDYIAPNYIQPVKTLSYVQHNNI